MWFSVKSLGRLIGQIGAAGVLGAGSACAGTLTTLYSFTSGGDGSYPTAGLVQDASGILYGATNHTGAAQCSPQSGTSVKGCGTVYSFSQAAGLKTIVTFTGPNGAHGANTLLLKGSTLYGSTTNGGTGGKGVLFSVQTDGTAFTLLHQFSGADGAGPNGALQLGAGGNLYGVAGSGGTYSHGVLFQLAQDGTYTVLHEFTGGTDGSQPDVVLASKSGALVGSAFSGGTKNAECSAGCGTVFAYVPATGKFFVLHQFNGVTDGATPYLGSLGAGNVAYGVANYLFSVTAPSNYTNLATFTSADGGDPFSGPALAADGTLIGTNSLGPNESSGAGTLYQEKNGTITNLYIFDGLSDGGTPVAKPLLSASGVIFGTTERGGTGCSSCGTIYEYSP